MSPHETDQRHFERQIAFARPIVVLLSLIALLEPAASRDRQRSIYFLISYLVLSLLAILIERMRRERPWYLPAGFDLVALGLLIAITPSMVPAWFPYLFVCYIAGIRWGASVALPLAGGFSLMLVLLTAVRGEMQWIAVLAWIGLVGATFAAGAGATFLGDRSRRFAIQSEFASRITGTLQVDRGLAECLRLLLNGLAEAFSAGAAMLAYRDGDLERVFVWRLKSGETERISPQSLPLTHGDDILLDDLDATVCWNSLGATASGFGWDRRNGRPLKTVPRLPGPTQHEMGIRSFMSVTFDQAGTAAGRLFLLNGRAAFTRDDLAWFESVARYVAPSLENVFLLRHLRVRAIEAERSRISRDLHDGILQTLLSIEIQLDVLRRRVAHVTADEATASLANLQQTVKNESAELRNMVTDMRPVRVQSADLVDLMTGFAERFRNESHIELDVLFDSLELQAPDRVCRELFQIYREALNNVKKHAKASHVVVKLSQDDSRLVLVVDDNGEGFSFAGKFTGDELDRLRLGPISIKERTRTVGGVLTVESNPGHGARLTVEIPLA
jgi:signal transduction histidine kinase